MTTKLKIKKASLRKPSKKFSPLSKSTEHTSKETLSPFVKSFIKRVQNLVAQHTLWNKNASFIVGVSGGADSLCLLDLLVVLSKKYNFSLHVAHVNYGLRGKDSILDEKLVVERAKAYRLSYSVLRSKKKVTGNLEEALRDIRYTFFEKLRKEKKYTHVVVAQHEDDQAETFLMRLLRGSGTKGLSSMQVKNGYLVRPLLHASKEDILQYLKERGISFRIDKSNFNQDFFRNRIRHELLPLLEKHYQPKVKQILAQTAELLGADHVLLQEFVSQSVEKKGNMTSFSFSRESILGQSDTLARHKLRFVLYTLSPTTELSKNLTDELLKALKSSKSKTQTVTFRRLKLVRKGDTVTLLNLAK